MTNIVRRTLIALIGVAAVVVPTASHAATATFTVSDTTAVDSINGSQCVSNTFDVSLAFAEGEGDWVMDIKVNDPEGSVVHTLRTSGTNSATVIKDMEMIFCGLIVEGTYTITGVTTTSPATTVSARTVARSTTATATFEVLRASGPAPSTATPTATSPTTTGQTPGSVRVRTVARGTKVIFRGGSEGQRWNVRVKGETRKVFTSPWEREVRLYKGAPTVKITTQGARIY